MAERLRALVPGLDILVAHGDLKPSAMDEVMVRFAEGDGDVLLATSDRGERPRRAPGQHHAGLGGGPVRAGAAPPAARAGRPRAASRHRPPAQRPGRAAAPAAALQRLRALEALDRLGAGFAVSARDLDLRGAGDLVGEDQAGHAKLVGLGLYQHLLQLALTAAKGERGRGLEPGDRTRPAEPDPGGLRARAGDPPEPLHPAPAPARARGDRGAGRRGRGSLRHSARRRCSALFDLARLRAACCELGVARLRGGPQGVAADLRPDRPLPAMAAAEGIVLRAGRVVWKRPCPEAAACAELASELLERVRAARERAA